MKFTYELVGVGWASATLGDGQTEIKIRASYLADALGDLLEAVGTLLEGAASARCGWEEEPGEWRWIFSRRGDDVLLMILGLPDNFPPLPDEEGTEVLTVREPLESIATTISETAQQVLNRYGEEEYRRIWVDAPFPTGQLHRVQEALARLQS